jgi:hypothetical protein
MDLFSICKGNYWQAVGGHFELISSVESPGWEICGIAGTEEAELLIISAGRRQQLRLPCN